MELLYHLETQLERQIIAQLQTALQQALDDYQSLCDQRRLAMHRHHRYARAIATGYGEVRVPIPAFRCRQCRRMTGGMTLLGAEMRYLRFSKKTMTSPSAWRRAWLSYARAGEWVGCAKSAICQWLRKSPLAPPQLPPDGTLELDGLWTRTRRGRAELKVIRNAAARMALGDFGSWAEVIDHARQQGAQHPAHLVSDGDGAIAAGIELVYGGDALHQLCAFHLLREYRRNIGMAGFAAARRLLDATSLAEGRAWARRIMRATDGTARYWCEKALSKGLRHLATGQVEHRTTSRLERHNRELRRREKLGTVWTEHNLLALLQEQGLLNQTT